jgi:hypothetical protein
MTISDGRACYFYSCQGATQWSDHTIWVIPAFIAWDTLDVGAQWFRSLAQSDARKRSMSDVGNQYYQYAFNHSLF